MANSWQVIVVKVQGKPADYLSKKTIETRGGDLATGTLLGGYLRARRFITKLTGTLLALAGGVYHGNIWTTVFDGGGVFPTGNIACVQANAATDTVTFTYGSLVIVFTEAATGAQGFARGASNTTCAANLAAAINAHPILGKLLVATPSVGNCALAALIPTSLLHNLLITTSDATAFTLTALTGGVPGTATLFPQLVATNKTPV